MPAAIGLQIQIDDIDQGFFRGLFPVLHPQILIRCKQKKDQIT
jgi:hypothetical protein